MKQLRGLYAQTFFTFRTALVFQTHVVQEIRTHFIQYNVLKKCAIYEIMRKHIVQPGRPQMTIMRMRFRCMVTKDADTHSEYVIFIASARQKWLHERA
jgi:hypothetical protein